MRLRPGTMAGPRAIRLLQVIRRAGSACPDRSRSRRPAPDAKPAGSTDRNALAAHPLLLWSIVLAGMVLRVHDYLLNHPLWWDECNSALNIVGRPFGALLEPLAYNQASPLGFLAGTKLAILALGNGEYALRLLPLIAGLASVPLFHALARRCLAPNVIWLPLALLAFSPRLLFYATEAKQYSLDLALTIAMILAARICAERGLRPRSAMALAVSGAAALWFSHPLAFVLAGVALYIILQAPSRSGKRPWRSLLGVTLTWSASFLITFGLSLRELITRGDMHEFWKAGSPLPGAPPGGAFLPMPPHSLGELAWPARVFFEFFDRPLGLQFAGLAALLVCLGAVSLARKDRPLLALLVIPAILALAASALQIYPFRYRLILFLVPSALLLLGRGARSLSAPVLGRHIPVFAVAGALLLVQPVGMALEQFARGPLATSSRSVLSDLSEQIRPHDVVYVYFGAERPWLYYAPRFDIEPSMVIAGIQPEHSPDELLADLPALRGHARVWLFFRHNTDQDRDLILGRLGEWGRETTRIRGDGEELFLYDLSPKPGHSPASSTTKN